MLKDGDDLARVTRDDTVWQFIENSVRPIQRQDGEITRAAVYTFESLIAQRWRKGRVLIAGDSAHRTPPFLGQGMCAGIRDAANLAWKLAAVCQGRASDALLNTYATERIPHVRAFILGAVEAGKTIQMSDPEELAARTRDMRANPKAYAPPNPALGPGLSEAHGQGGLGRQFVQPSIEGRLLDDHIGHDFAVVGRQAFIQTLTDRLRAKGGLKGLKLIGLPSELESSLEPYGSQAVLLRPDRYVHALIEDAEDLEACLSGLAVQLG
jgi:3-(3-hydroxy-phenyl)propionate hydroxylase